MRRPKLLDLFCAAGGAGVGYDRAGFDVTGVDINPQPRYPFAFVQDDAIAYYLAHRDEYDVVHASPPCQRWSTAGASRAIGEGHPDFLTPMRELFRAQDRHPWVLENIMGAPMPDSFMLCGSTFGLPIIRHRRFEWSEGFMLHPSSCPSPTVRGEYPHPGTYPYASKSWGQAWRDHVLPVVWPWMSLREAGLAIPPQYAEYIGSRILERLDLDELGTLPMWSTAELESA